MKFVFIINPVAGDRDIRQILSRQIDAAARQLNLPREDLIITSTTHAGHARHLAAKYASTGEPVRLFAAGGDGTLNEVLNGAWPYKNAAVGCLPYGSGNDFLRNFGSKEEFLNLADQLSGQVIDIDLMETPFGVGAAICAAGLDAQIAYNIPKFRRLPLCGGEAAYRLAILEQLLKPMGRELSITLDGETFTQTCLLTAICNGGYYGGGFRAAPDCAMDDGLLDVIVVKKVPLPRFVQALPIYQKGNHIRNGEVIPALRDVISFRRCRSVSLSIPEEKKKPLVVTIDGECRKTQELWVKVLPLAGRVVLPRSVWARTKNAQLNQGCAP